MPMKKHVIVIASYSFKGGTMYVKKYALQSNHTKLQLLSF